LLAPAAYQQYAHVASLFATFLFRHAQFTNQIKSGRGDRWL
jgi:hypothetical protein